eukprot:TRINITY_DN1778_c0_g2_i3.p1 TRINITY_DN1778_c0_g2~~TRINITY_DN1778_c0_g2_i3.p1  ORF type:complete len:271 (-),score=11.28 TRINITY_DN1778_c0_g2_i3:1225-2037(-)
MRPGVCRGLVEEEEEDTEGEQQEQQQKREQRDQPRVVSVVSQVLQRLVSRNDESVASTSDPSSKGGKVTVYHGVRAPGISIGKYMERIYKYTSCSPSCFVVGFIYIDRLIHRQPDFPLVSLTVHRLLLTSLLIAAKMLDDAHYNNAFYARVGGVSNVELNRLELDLLFRLDFRLKVSGKAFESYCLHLEKEMLCSMESPKIERILPSFNRLMTTKLPSESQVVKRETHQLGTSASASESWAGREIYFQHHCSQADASEEIAEGVLPCEVQ